ncbi:MAG TPA: hypothetical protein VFO16_03950 [Pseudonocardiaceae bacterium]|nr:hypothetical protein [Pseudonocardiaceae bacterium]
MTGMLAFTAISLAALTGAVAPASAAAARTAPHALTTLLAEDSPSQWVSTTDPDSGISVMLPGQPTLHKTTITINGKPIATRAYVRKLTGSHGVIVFMVMDGAAGVDLDAVMQGMTSTVGTNGTVTSSRHFVLDGRPALDGRSTFTLKNTPAVGLARFVSDGDRVVGIGTIGPVAEENTLTQVHQQALGTLQLPERPR